MGVKVHGTKNMRHRHNHTSHRWVPRHWGMRSFAKLPLGFVPVTITYRVLAVCTPHLASFFFFSGFPLVSFFPFPLPQTPHSLESETTTKTFTTDRRWLA